MTDPIERIGNASDRFTSLVATNKERITKQAVNAVLLFVICAVFGCFDFIHLRFNFAVFDFVNNYTGAMTYWTKVIAKTIAGVCAYNIGMNLRWDNEMGKSVTLKEQISEYERLMKFRDPQTFNNYVINVFNPAEKKKAWVDYISRKIYRLNKFAKHKDQILYSNEKATAEEKAKNRYCRKRAELEEMKSSEWVDKNIDSVFVKYYPVDPIVFDLDVDGKTETRGAKVVGNVALAKARYTGSTMFSIVAVSAFTASLMMEPSKEEFASQMEAFGYYLQQCLQDVLIIAWQTFRGMNVDRKIINSEYTIPYTQRNKVLSEYISWCAETKIPESKTYRILKEIEKLEEQAKEPRKEIPNECSTD